MSEPFYKTMKKRILDSRFGDYLEIKPNAKEYMEEVFYCFELNGSFLDVIPIEKRDDLIDEIVQWILDMSDNLSKDWYAKKILTKQKRDKIESELNTIRKMKRILDNDGDGIEMATNNKTEQAARVYAFLGEIERDLENNEFKIMMKHRYEREPNTTKGELKEAIANFQSMNGLNRTPGKIKTLVDPIPFITDWDERPVKLL